METIEGSAKKLTVAMGKVGDGNKEAIENFKQLGVSVKDAKGNLLSTDQVMPNVINKLADMKNVTERNALGVKIFGKSFMDMAPMLNDGSKGVEDFKKEAQKLGLVLSDDAIKAGAKFDDTMVKVKASLGMVTTVVGNQVMPIIQKAMDFILANMPQIQAVTGAVFNFIGNAIGVVANFFTGTLLPAIKSIWEWVQPYMPMIQANIKDCFDKIKIAVQIAVDIFNVLVDALTKVGNWISEHQALVETIAIVVGSFALAWGAVNLALGIWATVGLIATGVTTGFGVAMALLTSPIFLIVLAIGVVIAVGILLYKNWDTIKAKAIEFKDAIVSKFTEIKTNVVNKITELKQGAIDKFVEIKTGITDKVQQIKDGVVNKFNEIVGSARNTFDNVKNAVMTPIYDLKSKVSGVVDSIKGFFSNLNITIPHIKMPHFSINGSFNLAKMQVPSLGVNWYAQGGVFNSPSVIGVGESGQEAVMPLQHNTGWIDTLAKKLNGKGNSGNNGLNVTITNFINNREQDVQAFAEELEFYRKQQSLSGSR